MAKVIDLQSRRSTQAKTTETVKIDPAAPSEYELEAWRKLRDAIDKTTEAEDKIWLQYTDFEDYSGCLDDQSQILDNFESNYTSKTLGYFDFDQLSGNAIRAVMPAETLHAKIMEYSALEALDDIYTQWNEMGSVQIGEVEHQIDIEAHTDPEILLALANMSDADLKRFNDWSYLGVHRGHFFTCGRPCERLVLKLNVESFLADSEVKAILAKHYEA